MKKGKALALVSAFGLLITGGVAEASTDFVPYKKKVPAFNGSAYTSYQQLTGYDTVLETINVVSTSVGGDYTVDIRGQRNTGKDRYTDWERNVGDNYAFNWAREILNSSDSAYRLQLSNDLSTPVEVLATGSFKTH
ncbi:hypothetical protein M3582_01130 [Priestia megaterium]|uniref:hypothetical protein n=1 Tax=Priestia megaterium TaxID=1404 RepID=UPI0011A0F14D|nr:hypothetical protein [Priestia megaterium]MCM3016674.1 hypothetical protein [Priestia megaterium]